VLKLQDNIEDVKLMMKDAVEAVSFVASKHAPTLTDVADKLKEAAQQSTGIAGNEAQIAVEGIADTAKNVMSAIDPNDTDKHGKKGKKKGKKKKNKNKKT
jgi:hypothetical protein